MRGWPPINEPELLARLALGYEEFQTLLLEYSSAVGSREFTPAILARALSYPFERPAGSFMLDGTRVEPLAAMEPDSRNSTIADFTAKRHPILAFGGNGSPEWLEAKFAHFASEVDRQILVLTGYLHDIDVGATASISPFGNMPAAIFSSPGTSVRAAMLWCTDAQVTQLTWSELPYRLGRLDEATFSPDESDVVIDHVFAYVHRFGAFCVDGEPVALDAVAAINRKAKAFSQEELLDLVAPRFIGPGARAEDLVRAIWEDMGAITERSAEVIWPFSQQLLSPWTPYPAEKMSN